MYRQGDVLIVPVSEVNGKQSNPKQIVLAHGEATGHAHTITDETTLLFNGPNGEVYIDATEHTEVRHQEHDTIPIPPGTYRVIRQREYTPERTRNVAD